MRVMYIILAVGGWLWCVAFFAYLFGRYQRLRKNKAT